MSTSTPWSVTTIVCSNCGEGLPSLVTAVQPSSSMSLWWVPRLIMGSIVKTCPGLSAGLAGGPVMDYVGLAVKDVADAMPHKSRTTP